MLMPWYIYIIECKDGLLYTGITKDLLRRTREHNNGNGCRFTRYRFPVTLLYSEKASARPEALRREAQIKRLGKPQKLKLIQKKRRR